MSINKTITDIKPGALFLLGEKIEVESHISVLFPHWSGGNVVVTDVKETKLFKANSVNSAGTVTIVEFLFQGQVYSEGIQDFINRAEHID